MPGNTSVRPFQHSAPKKKGLSQETEEEPDDMLVTVDGKMLPKDVVERDAETARNFEQIHAQLSSLFLCTTVSFFSVLEQRCLQKHLLSHESIL